MRARKESEHFSAKIEKTIFDRLTDYSDTTGIPKTRVVEQALNMYLDHVAPVKIPDNEP